ncbi:MAG: hypothetical protein ACE5EQ_04205 [Phycisphaerae bacterium]
MSRNGLMAAMGLGIIAWTGTANASVTLEPKSKAKVGFERWDKNQDGVIDREEFKKAQRQFRKRVARRQDPDGPRVGDRPGPKREAMEHHIRDIVRQTVEQMWREHQARIGEMIREAIGHAMRQRAGRRGDGPRGPAFREQAAPRFDGPPPLAGPRHNRDRRGHAPGMKHGQAMRHPRSNRGPDMHRDGPHERMGPGEHAGPRGSEHRRGRDRARGPMPRPGRIFKQHDVNGDGFLTPDEFPGNPKRFDRLDKNDDGKLTRKELRKIRRHPKSRSR